MFAFLRFSSKNLSLSVGAKWMKNQFCREESSDPVYALRNGSQCLFQFK
jgi:hypothetical protein